VRMSVLSSAAAVFCLATGAAAQERPDFSGRWTAEAQPSAASPRGGGADTAQGARGGRGGRGARGDMGSGWGRDITITQEANRLTIEYAFFTRGDMQPPLRFSYALDGSETKNSVMMGRGVQVQTSRTAWQGEKLVITTLYAFINPQNGQPMTSEMVQTLSLDPTGMLMVETGRSGVLGGPASTTRTVYRKQ
jgi:hypothetical protein